ncbi:TrlF family AAA-like ATPase [Desulfobacca acetoxidans]
MAEKYTKARFWKCALQVNSATYINYRGDAHGMTEEEYNRELLRVCREEEISIIGLADHGNVDAVDAIRELMAQEGIVVFPGFEIASTEKAHFVCLFPETTSKDQLTRYLGALGLTNPAAGIWPSNLGGNDLFSKVNELGGIAYAAHCIDDNGVLFRKLQHVWRNPLLKAAQIPGALDDLKNEEENGYRQILLNRNPDYRRERPIAIINAKDVARPEDLRNPKASCLIKMTRPCFVSFKQAFLDPESRVRLNSDVPEKYYSRIESVKSTGGYLDGLEIDFSEHLNAVIGGRGTGKSTLLECIRYALELRPLAKNAQKQHDEIIRENLGKEKGRIELTIRSSAMHGKRFLISRRYGESATVRDEFGNPSAFSPADVLPRIEIYGQNEIYEIAQNPQGRLRLLNRFLDIDNRQLDQRLEEIARKLKDNRKAILQEQENLAQVEDEVSRLPKLQEQVEQFKKLRLDEKLKIIPLLESEKRLSGRVSEEIENLETAFIGVENNLPDTIFLCDNTLKGLPHESALQSMRTFLDELTRDVRGFVQQTQEKIAASKDKILGLQETLAASIRVEEEALEKAFREIPSYEGRSGPEIGMQYHTLLKDIERIRPKEVLLASHNEVKTELSRMRRAFLSELSEARAQRSAQLQRALKKVNRRLTGKLRLTVSPEADRGPLMEFLNACGLEGVGLKRLAWIEAAEDFSPLKLAEMIRNGVGTLKQPNWGITQSVAEALVKLPLAKLMEIEELELPDTISIELNVSPAGKENYRPLDKLSTGQQCTAILHILLLENLDPLIMDQPEDNLDNAFIADRIVAELRSAKIARQFLFATHNANIPVFGDAEWIGVFQVVDGHSEIPEELQGAIDLPEIQQKAAEILEGGKSAFIQRKEKYGF